VQNKIDHGQENSNPHEQESQFSELSSEKKLANHLLRQATQALAKRDLKTVFSLMNQVQQLHCLDRYGPNPLANPGVLQLH